MLVVSLKKASDVLTWCSESQTCWPQHPQSCCQTVPPCSVQVAEGVPLLPHEVPLFRMQFTALGTLGAVCLSESPSAFYRSSWLSWSGAWGRGLSFSSCMTQGCQEQLESPLMSISAVTHHCCRRHWFPKWDSLVPNSILAKTAWHSLYITSRQVSSGFNSLLSRTFQCLKNLCWDFLIFQTLISEHLGDKNPQETKISTASRHLCTYSAIYSQRTSGTQHHRIFWLGAHTGFAEQFCNKNYITAVFFTCGACQVQAQDSKQFTWASPGCDSGSLSIASSSRDNIHPSSLPASSVSMQNQNKLPY